MRCPICEETLQLTDRQGIEIDYCPRCRGIWLDRGELQKLIDLSMAQLDHHAERPTAPRVQPIPVPPQPNGYPHPQHHGHDSHYGYGKPKKKESWLSELFDWD